MKLFAAIILSIATLATPLSNKDKDLPPAQLELVNAERAFAQLAIEKGFRDSFYTYFADDGIAFNPHPFNVRESLKNQPSSPAPFGIRWAPVYGDIAQAGDLGWNTGPTVFVDNSPEKKPTRHGMFFSLWKKQSDGAWRVVLDLGADTPSEVVPLNEPFHTSFRKSSKRSAAPVNMDQEVANLLKIERDFLASAKSGLGQAYKKFLSNDARVHRPNAMPVVGKEALSWAAQQNLSLLAGDPTKADVSRSGDLGYTYGGYELGGAKSEKGYFVRVWKRNDKGEWRIVMDTVSPVPPQTKPAATQTNVADALLKKADAHYAAQEWKEAAAAYQDYVKQVPDKALAWHRLGTAQIFLQQFAEGIKSLEQAIKAGGSGPLDYYNMACAYARLGEKDKALDNLEKAISGGFTNRQQYETDSDLDSLREMERFKELMKRLP